MVRVLRWFIGTLKGQYTVSWSSSEAPKGLAVDPSCGNGPRLDSLTRHTDP